MTSPGLGYRTRGRAAVIALPQRAEAGSVFTLRSRSERALNAGHRWIAVDLRAVDDIDTPTLAQLCAALRQISAHGHRLTIVGADLRVQWGARDLRHRRGRASPNTQERPRPKPRHSEPANPPAVIRAITFAPESDFPPESDLRPLMINLAGGPLLCSLLRGSGSRQEPIPECSPPRNRVLQTSALSRTGPRGHWFRHGKTPSGRARWSRIAWEPGRYVRATSGSSPIEARLMALALATCGSERHSGRSPKRRIPPRSREVKTRDPLLGFG
jgi:hypothetical protein